MKRKAYAVRLSKDPIGRKQVALLKMAGFSSQKIADLTGRHKRTINKELTRPEHRKLFHKCITAIVKKELSGDARAVVEKALKEREA